MDLMTERAQASGPQLRSALLNAKPQDFQLVPTQRWPDVWAALFEMPVGDGDCATIVAVADGSASVYTTAGFGIIGAGSHPGPRRAADAFLDAVQAATKSLQPVAAANEVDYPSPGSLAIVALTHAGIRRLTVPDTEVDAQTDVAEALRAGNDLMTEIRLIDEEQRGR
jgi:hypothetical protein